MIHFVLEQEDIAAHCSFGFSQSIFMRAKETMQRNVCLEITATVCWSFLYHRLTSKKTSNIRSLFSRQGPLCSIFSSIVKKESLQVRPFCEHLFRVPEWFLVNAMLVEVHNNALAGPNFPISTSEAVYKSFTHRILWGTNFSIWDVTFGVSLL